MYKPQKSTYEIINNLLRNRSGIKATPLEENGYNNGVVYSLFEDADSDLLWVLTLARDMAVGISSYTIDSKEVNEHIEKVYKENPGGICSSLRERIQNTFSSYDRVGLYKQKNMKQCCPTGTFCFDIEEKKNMIVASTTSGHDGAVFQQRLVDILNMEDCPKTVSEVDAHFRQRHDMGIFEAINKLEQDSRKRRFKLICLFASSLGLVYNGDSFVLNEQGGQSTVNSTMFGCEMKGRAWNDINTNVGYKDNMGKYIFFLGAAVISNSEGQIICPDAAWSNYYTLNREPEGVRPIYVEEQSSNIMTFIIPPIPPPNFENMTNFILWYVKAVESKQTHVSETQTEKLLDEITRPYVQIIRPYESKVFKTLDLKDPTCQTVLSCLSIPPWLLTLNKRDINTSNHLRPLLVLVASTPDSLLRRIWGSVMQELNAAESSKGDCCTQSPWACKEQNNAQPNADNTEDENDEHKRTINNFIRLMSE